MTMRELVYLAAATYGWMFQRPHHILTELSMRGRKCYFCSEEERREVSAKLTIGAKPHEFRSKSDNKILLVSFPLSLSFCNIFKNSVVWYDILDAHDFYRKGRDLRAIEVAHKRLLQEADIVTYTSSVLKPQRSDAVQIYNACAWEHFASYDAVKLSRINSWIKNMRTGDFERVIGYVGAIAEWIDWRVVQFLLTVRPKWLFVFIGGKYRNVEKRVLRYRNYVSYNHIAYDWVSYVMKTFDACIIPFVQDSVTRAVDPIKMYEYLAAGKSVVTTEMPECRRVPLVRVSSNPREMVALLDEAVNDYSSEVVAQRVNFAKENTWKHRCNQIEPLLAKYD